MISHEEERREEISVEMTLFVRNRENKLRNEEEM